MKRIDLVYNFCKGLFKSNEAFLNFFENHYANFFVACKGKKKLNREFGLNTLIIDFRVNVNDLNIQGE